MSILDETSRPVSGQTKNSTLIFASVAVNLQSLATKNLERHCSTSRGAATGVGIFALHDKGLETAMRFCNRYPG
jgi:hypothetical protein